MKRFVSQTSCNIEASEWLRLTTFFFSFPKRCIRKESPRNVCMCGHQVQICVCDVRGKGRMYNCNWGEFCFVSPFSVTVCGPNKHLISFCLFLRLCRCNEPPMGCPLLICSMGEFLYSFRCCSNPRGRCPALRLLLILRRLTDIQSELVLYWKLKRRQRRPVG